MFSTGVLCNRVGQEGLLDTSNSYKDMGRGYMDRITKSCRTCGEYHYSSNNGECSRCALLFGQCWYPNWAIMIEDEVEI